jgi:hypothetical protein
MMPSPDPITLQRVLQSAARRLGQRALLEGATIGLGFATLATLLGWPTPPADLRHVAFGIALALLGAALRYSRTALTPAAAARALEARAPECRNLLITATELHASPSAGYVETLVLERASALAGTLSVSVLIPLGRSLRGAGLALLLWGAAVAWRHDTVRAVITPAGASSGAPDVMSLEVEVLPPAYSGRAAEKVTDPARITMLQGSRLRFRGRANADRVSIETLEGTATLPVTSGNAFTGEVTVAGDGFVALTPIAAGGAAGARRLIGVTVLPDESPRVRITVPGRDLGVPDGNRSIAVTIDARDDIGLATLTMRAVTVSGSGERFTFREQEIPITVQRQDARQWSAKATLALAPLGLEPGDMVVYRAIATDARPGSVPVESDAWIVEVLSPGSVAAEGFAIDPEQDRYALSQQMVILKTERLLAKRNALSAEAFADSAVELAAEQRRVRAEFVFMMGGEVEDEHGHEGDPNELNEVAEAEAEDELLAGRLQNAGRLALLRGIRFMSLADRLLNSASVPEALRAERQALVEIEKAFARSRIILRALTQREQLDMTRRLTGARDSATGSTRQGDALTRDPQASAMRRLLAELAALQADSGVGAARAARATALAEASLRIDPSSAVLQEVSRLLQGTATAYGAGGDDRSAALLDSASLTLSRVMTRTGPIAPGRRLEWDGVRLRGAATDAIRQRGGQP